MMKIVNRLLINICSDKLSVSSEFYVKLFDFKIEYESDWFIHLKSRENNFELGIIDRKNELVPEEYQKSPQGFYLTLVVDSADAIYKEALKSDIEIIKEPHDTNYGQRRCLLKDPNGTLIDVSSLMPNGDV